MHTPCCLQVVPNFTIAIEAHNAALHLAARSPLWAVVSAWYGHYKHCKGFCCRSISYIQGMLPSCGSSMLDKNCILPRSDKQQWWKPLPVQSPCNELIKFSCFCVMLNAALSICHMPLELGSQGLLVDPEVAAGSFKDSFELKKLHCMHTHSMHSLQAAALGAQTC